MTIGEDLIQYLPQLIVGNNKVICRSRINMDPKCFYYKATDLYDPHGNYAKLGRANFDGQQIFYGSIKDFKKEEERLAYSTNLFEVSQLLRNKGENGRQVITLSAWFTKCNLRLVSIPSFANVKSKTDIQTQVNQMFDGCKYSCDIIKKIKELSDLFMRDVEEQDSIEVYKKSAQVASEIWDKHKDIDGLLYPSIQLDGDGMNIALRPEAADEKLELRYVSVWNLFKKGDEAEFVPVYEVANVQQPFFRYKRHYQFDSARFEGIKNAYDVPFV